jgi:L-aminopeptidase/D-esterase-like protein
MGAKAGLLKGGLGSASAVDPGTACTVGALVAVNAVGSAVVPGGPAFWAFMLEQDGEFGGLAPPSAPVAMAVDLGVAAEAPAAGEATTIAVIATDADLDRQEARRVAIMAQDGIARAIRPAHTPFDGDLVFVVATGAVALAGSRPHGVGRLGAIAADCLARAIARGVFEAETLGDRRSWREVWGRR